VKRIKFLIIHPFVGGLRKGNEGGENRKKRKVLGASAKRSLSSPALPGKSHIDGPDTCKTVVGWREGGNLLQRAGHQYLRVQLSPAALKIKGAVATSKPPSAELGGVGWRPGEFLGGGPATERIREVKREGIDVGVGPLQR